jgi:hypothetical protein
MTDTNEILKGLLWSWDRAQRTQGEELLLSVEESGLLDLLRACRYRLRIYQWLKDCGDGHVADPPQLADFKILVHPEFGYKRDPLTRGASPLRRHPPRGWFTYQTSGVGMVVRASMRGGEDQSAEGSPWWKASATITAGLNGEAYIHPVCREVGGRNVGFLWPAGLRKTPDEP